MFSIWDKEINNIAELDKLIKSITIYKYSEHNESISLPSSDIPYRIVSLDEVFDMVSYADFCDLYELLFRITTQDISCNARQLLLYYRKNRDQPLKSLFEDILRKTFRDNDSFFLYNENLQKNSLTPNVFRIGEGNVNDVSKDVLERFDEYIAKTKTKYNMNERKQGRGKSNFISYVDIPEFLSIFLYTQKSNSPKEALNDIANAAAELLYYILNADKDISALNNIMSRTTAILNNIEKGSNTQKKTYENLFSDIVNMASVILNDIEKRALLQNDTYNNPLNNIVNTTTSILNIIQNDTSNDTYTLKFSDKELLKEIVKIFKNIKNEKERLSSDALLFFLELDKTFRLSQFFILIHYKDYFSIQNNKSKLSRFFSQENETFLSDADKLFSLNTLKMGLLSRYPNYTTLVYQVLINLCSTDINLSTESPLSLYQDYIKTVVNDWHPHAIPSYCPMLENPNYHCDSVDYYCPSVLGIVSNQGTPNKKCGVDYIIPKDNPEECKVNLTDTLRKIKLEILFNNYFRNTISYTYTHTDEFDKIWSTKDIFNLIQNNILLS